MRHIHELDLADQDRVGARGGEAAGGAGGLGGKAERGDDRRFLHRQGHDVVLAVDQEIETETDGEAHDTDDVFDHGVGVADIEDGLTVDQGLVILRRQQTPIANGADPLLYRQLVERWEAGAAHCVFNSFSARFEDPFGFDNGRPHAATLNRAVSSKLLRMTVFESVMMAATLRRDTLTCSPAVNKGSAEIFRRVVAASRRH